jgi:hypothetical protein
MKNLSFWLPAGIAQNLSQKVHLVTANCYSLPETWGEVALRYSAKFRCQRPLRPPDFSSS